MASLLRSRVSGCTKRIVLQLQASPNRVCKGNSMRWAQRRFASDQSSGGTGGGSGTSLTMPLLGAASLGLVVYFVS